MYFIISVIKIRRLLETIHLVNGEHWRHHHLVINLRLLIKLIERCKILWIESLNLFLLERNESRSFRFKKLISLFFIKKLRNKDIAVLI